MKHLHRAFRVIPAFLLGSTIFAGVAAANDMYSPGANAGSNAANAAANAASQAASSAANSATQAARDDADGKIHIFRSEARDRYRKAYEKNKDRAAEKGISDDDLKKRIKAAILKKYAIDDDPAPAATSEVVASAAPVDPPTASPPDTPPAPPDNADRVKRLTPQQLAAIAARLDEVKRQREEAERSRLAALEEQNRKQAALQAYNESRVYDRQLASWVDHHSQQLPDGTWGLASDWNAKLVQKYAKDTGGVNLQQIWEDQERAKVTGETLINRDTPPPAKEPFKPQSDHYTENDPRPQPPPNYVRP